MTKKKEMRIKEVGATINLGNYSTLHVTVGEESEYAGLELQRTTAYLRSIAEKVGGVLNLPDEMVNMKKNKKNATPLGVRNLAFGSGTPIWYDHLTHTYTAEDGEEYQSVTQFLGKYYPMNEEIAKEYLDFASSFGNLIHTAVQNSILGKPPKKELTGKIIEDAVATIGEYDHGFVEQLIVLPQEHLAGRFDILTETDGQNTLWDVKTNSDLTIKVESTLPQEVKDYLLDFWNPDTIYGEHCLQLNLYAYIIEQTTGRKIDEIKILHIPDSFKKTYVVSKIDMAKVLEMLKDGQERTE